MVLLEDIDLSAVNRSFARIGSNALCSKCSTSRRSRRRRRCHLLLTTNRVDILELSLAKRPGRVMQRSRSFRPTKTVAGDCFAFTGLPSESMLDEGLQEPVDATNGPPTTFEKSCDGRLFPLQKQSRMCAACR